MTRFANGILRSYGTARRHRGNDSTGTPRALFLQLDTEFGFTLDAAASAENALVSTYYTEADDALAQPWAPHVVWCNPPYKSDGVGAWMAKAWKESRLGATVVLLLPVRADLSWWHDYALRGEIRFIRGRLRFEGNKTSAPFASCVVVFRPAGGSA